MSGKSVITSLVPPIDRVVIVGASLAGLRAAEALRDEGFTGPSRTKPASKFGSLLLSVLSNRCKM
jgi:hypothetical protein